ncbi:carbon-nitrogen hydrolase family protein [Kordiimonas gwangyangensis]|uniref:carbon-nitrogen hydrolase family protein n=1 Tax=Kordiimonas gwangyangensis TaxID=288022 RepID=UPI00035C91F2|nr:carbon-nitrogen hydrolase family protein [Kordiimonas gwangyangensis]
MRAALIQLNTGNEVLPAVDAAEALIREAASGGADFVTTPETTHLMEMNRKVVMDKVFYQDEDPGLARFRELAAELGVWLHIGSLITKVAEDRLANRAHLIAPSGEIAASYDKMHMFDVDLGGGEVYRESTLYKPGTEAHVVKTPIGTFGISVCYDLRFPYLYRAMADAGANIMLIPAAFTKPTGEAHWHTLQRARAIETGSFVLAAAQTGHHATGRDTYGHSLGISPWGEVLVDGGTAVGVSYCDIDLAKVAEARQKIPSLTHTRTFDLKVSEVS